MKNEAPHAVSDEAPAGSQSESEVNVTFERERRQKLIVSIGFDENIKEFQLWDYLYDFNTDHFEMEAVPDYENRIQFYEITIDVASVFKFRMWLRKNKIEYRLDKV